MQYFEIILKWVTESDAKQMEFNTFLDVEKNSEGRVQLWIHKIHLLILFTYIITLFHGFTIELRKHILSTHKNASSVHKYDTHWENCIIVANYHGIDEKHELLTINVLRLRFLYFYFIFLINKHDKFHIDENRIIWNTCLLDMEDLKKGKWCSKV